MSGEKHPQAGERESGGRAAARIAVLLCGTPDFCSDARRELQRRGRNGIALLVAHGISDAERTSAEELPAVIVAEDRALVEESASPRQRRQSLVSAISRLARYAPVVWVGAPEMGEEITGAVRSGVADFVPRSPTCVSAAITMVERHLNVIAPRLAPRECRAAAAGLRELSLEGQDFGELLRHELNNPLTGILGNAELLLLEVRRGKLDLPAQTLQRLEVITELAVRMRETVRQLSDRWMATGGEISAENGQGAGHPH